MAGIMHARRDFVDRCRRSSRPSPCDDEHLDRQHADIIRAPRRCGARSLARVGAASGRSRPARACLSEYGLSCSVFADVEAREMRRRRRAPRRPKLRARNRTKPSRMRAAPPSARTGAPRSPPPHHRLALAVIAEAARLEHRGRPSCATARGERAGVSRRPRKARSRCRARNEILFGEPVLRHGEHAGRAAPGCRAARNSAVAAGTFSNS